MKILALSEGGVKCSSACPYYEESGVIQAIGGPMKTHCQAVMQDVIIDCHVFDPSKTLMADVTEDQVREMAKTLKIPLRKVRKLYPRNHKEIHPVGWKVKKSEIIKS